MLLYTLYNADLLDLPDNQEAKDVIGYIALITVGDDLTETTNRLKNLMTKAGGGLEWSLKHNSRFEVNKSAIQHFTRKTIQDPECYDSFSSMNTCQTCLTRFHSIIYMFLFFFVSWTCAFVTLFISTSICRLHALLFTCLYLASYMRL